MSRAPPQQHSMTLLAASVGLLLVAVRYLVSFEFCASALCIPLIHSSPSHVNSGPEAAASLAVPVSPDDSLKFTPPESVWEEDVREAREDQQPVDEQIPPNFRPMAEDSIAWRTIFKLGRPLNKSLVVEDRWNGTTLEERGIRADMGVHLVTTFFKGSYHDRRFKEIMATLVSNLENPSIAAVHLLCQAADPREYLSPEAKAELEDKGLAKKLVLTFVTRQPTYRNLFEYVNKRLQRGAVAVVTNADIYFAEDVGCFVASTARRTPRLAVALTRRHSPICKGKADHLSTYDLCETYVGSHDSFVLAPPIAKTVVYRTAHTQNQGYGAENIVIYELKRAGYRVINPCFHAHGYHFHCSPERHYHLMQINKYPPRPGVSYPIKQFKCPVGLI